MLKIAHISIMIILTAVVLAGCTGTTNTPTATPTATAPSNQTDLVNQSGTVSATPVALTPSPTTTVAPNRTTQAQVRTITSLCNVEFRVYTDKVVIDYLNGAGNLTVIASNVAGSGDQKENLSGPGDNVTINYDRSMPREPGLEANIFVYQPTDSGMTYGGTTYYPRTGEVKQN